MNATDSIDPQALALLREINPEDDAFVRELVDMYLQDLPSRLRELDQALATGDMKLLVRAAHTIKGSSGNFGARELSRVAETIEQLGKKESTAEVPALLAALKEEVVRVGVALNQLVPAAGAAAP